MKRTVLLLLALGSIAVANPVCTSDTIANYITNYNSLANACMVGDKLFYNFF